MQKILALTVPALLCGATAFAADHPRAEAFFGYTYTRVNSATNIPAFSANGGGGQVALNLNSWFGIVMDMGAVHNGNISDIHLDTTIVNYMIGPRFSLRYSRITPYFHILGGGAYVTSSIQTSGIPVPPLPTQPIYLPGDPNPIQPNSPVTLRAVADQNSWAGVAGGGLDIKINKWASFRPIGLDYFRTGLSSLRSGQDNSHQHHLRYTMGFNFTFGAN